MPKEKREYMDCYDYMVKVRGFKPKFHTANREDEEEDEEVIAHGIISNDYVNHAIEKSEAIFGIEKIRYF